MSEFNQTSFLGGINLLSDDTRLKPNEYRCGFNLRNRYDTLDIIRQSVKDTSLPSGIIQEALTFGNYLIVFISGLAYYRLYSSTSWTRIGGFKMNTSAPRYWTCSVPVGTTNYVRVAQVVSADTLVADGRLPVQQINVVSGTAQGNLPGLVVQDNINQPQFLFLDNSGHIQIRTTQRYDQWFIDYVAATGQLIIDAREYVPVGNAMAYVDGVLYVVSQKKDVIYRSVSGRPLDFVINIAPDGTAGGDANTTSYSVGVSQISCLRGMPDGSLFVAAGNSNFLIIKNTANNAPLIFGEYLFVRKYLFEATCLNDRCIIDSLGDTRFIDLTGVRSFNAIEQLQNEGRNSSFTATIQLAFKGIVQDVAAAILFDNYEFYAVNTSFGYCIAVYDTLVGCWSSFDFQVGNKKIKQLLKIELGIQRLFAVTEDNELYTLYSSDSYSTGSFISPSISANMLNYSENIKLNNAKNEIKALDFRCILNRITESCQLSVTPIIDNRLSFNVGSITKKIKYIKPAVPYTDSIQIPDINSQLTNIYAPMPNCEQGWKTSMLVSWNNGSITQFSVTLKDETPNNPLNTQATSK